MSKIKKIQRVDAGFTLVEIIIALAIIAILTIVGLTVFSGLQKKARISKRLEDMQSIRKALSLYATDNKTYPSTSSTWKSECSSYGSVSASSVIPGLVPNYIASMPQDPSMNTSSNTSCYVYWSNGTDYKFMDYNISEFSASDYQAYRDYIDPARDGGSDTCSVDGTSITAWAVYTPGACSQ